MRGKFNSLFIFLVIATFGRLYAGTVSVNTDSILEEINQNFTTSTRSETLQLDEEALFAPSTSSDSDTGEHLILSPIPNRGVLTVNWQNRFVHSNNIGNTDIFTEPGFLFHTNFRANWTKLIGKNLFLDLDFRENRFQFETQNDFDFSLSRFGVGVTKIIDPIDVAISASYVYKYARTNIISDELYRTSGFELFAGKTIYHNLNHISFIGAQIDIAQTSTDQVIKRNRYLLRGGHTVRLQEKTFVTGFVDYQLNDYTLGGREESSLIAGLSIEYKLSDTWSTGASFAYTNNDSNIDFFDYTGTLSSVFFKYKNAF